MNAAHNLLVASINKLQEYTTHGSRVREISLQFRPWHAIQLYSGDYAVSHYWSPGVVSVVGADGRLKQQYGQSQLSDVGQTTNPTSLAVTSNDDILVADKENSQIMLIRRSTTGAVEQLALPVDQGLRCPHCLCLDESQGRLYVVETRHRVLLGDGFRLIRHRVLVFDGFRV